MNKVFLIATTFLLLIIFNSHAFAQNSEKLVVLETNLGNIVIDFFPDDAPNHVENFIKLAESGFYDGTLFHRIISGFMIQGGDPNTVNGTPNTWGTGGSDTNVNAEFNTIMHDRGIVSMARSQDPNSAGSQFFIVHGDAHFLDQQYTVFGRIVTEESFETLDKIAAVQTGGNNTPLDPQQVKIISATAVDESQIPNLLELSEPQRVSAPIPISKDDPKFESVEHNIKFNVPEGWFIQELDDADPLAPDMVAVGPKTGAFNPAISLTVKSTDGKTFEKIVSENHEILKPVIESKELLITSEEDTTIVGNKAHIITAERSFSSGGGIIALKFQEVFIYDVEKFYVFSYVNTADNFDLTLPRFIETLDSIELPSQDASNDEITSNDDNGGGCLIATATYGSEMAPQVQQLRELRDNTILSTESGTAFMSGFNEFYYSFSPTIADLERENFIFKEVVKLSITPMLATLSILNHVEINSEAEMLSAGIGIILMNVGMYFATPALIIIYKIRK